VKFFAFKNIISKYLFDFFYCKLAIKLEEVIQSMNTDTKKLSVVYFLIYLFSVTLSLSIKTGFSCIFTFWFFEYFWMIYKTKQKFDFIYIWNDKKKKLFILVEILFFSSFFWTDKLDSINLSKTNIKIRIIIE